MAGVLRRLCVLCMPLLGNPFCNDAARFEGGFQAYELTLSTEKQ